MVHRLSTLLLRPLWLLALVASGVVLAHGRGQPFEALYWLCVGYIPSFITYLFVSWLPQKRMRSVVATYSMQVVGTADAILRALRSAANVAATEAPTQEEYERLCASECPLQAAPQFMGTWLEYLSLEKARSQQAHRQLLTVGTYVEAAHLKLLIEIDDCVLFMMLDALGRSPPSNPNLAFLARNLSHHYDATRDLKRYVEANMPGSAWPVRRR